jgi:hypothetical protein
MPRTQVTFEPSNPELRSSGKVVGITDRIYSIIGSIVTFDDVLIKGDLSGVLEYNGAKLRVVRIHTMIGLEATLQGVRGPVWKGVECEVIE